MTPAGTRSYSLEPKDLGIPRCEIADLAGGAATHNANLLMVLSAPPEVCWSSPSCCRAFRAAHSDPQNCTVLSGAVQRLMSSCTHYLQDVFGGERQKKQNEAVADALNLTAGAADGSCRVHMLPLVESLNALIDAAQDVFGGERNAIADALNLNAGVALHAANVASSPTEGVAMAQEAQRSGSCCMEDCIDECKCLPAIKP